MSTIPSLAPAFLPESLEGLRQEVRAFLRAAIPQRTAAERAQSWMGFDASFSRQLGERGWIGMTWPTAYGGGGLSAFDRYVVIEELLAAGAPVSAHWIADRQSGALLLRFGTETQRQKYLPAICRGESYFCIGMSEPGAGSDLASIRTTARRTAGGWTLNGAKLWTTNAHRSHHMIVLARSAEGSERQEGLSQFVVDLTRQGVTIRPISDLGGSEHFNEVVFDDVHLDDGDLIGSEGQGWSQVMAELALERSGPERFLSSIQVLKSAIGVIDQDPDRQKAVEVGRLAARLQALRQMSLSVTAQLAVGADPTLAASCVKDLGNAFEQHVPETLQSLLDVQPRRSGEDIAQALFYTVQAAPSFSLRGGTREILRGIIARGLGLR